jgi:hypothetical protein
VTGLVAGVERAFVAAAGELGMWTAAWLVSEETVEAGGAAALETVREVLGRSYPILDAVATQRLRGTRASGVDATPVVAALEGSTSVLVVGLEADALDALLPGLTGRRVGLVASPEFDVDWDRVLANLDGDVVPVSLDALPRWTGRRSAILTFGYGVRGERIFVPPVWLRVDGPDVRTQVRTLVAWNVLGRPPFLHPQWLRGTPTSSFSVLVGAP